MSVGFKTRCYYTIVGRQQHWGEDEWRRVHGNDERISLENLREGVRCHTEMLLEMAAA